jgi:hypothetical protein
LDSVSIDVIDRLYVAEGHTLGVSVAVVTFYGHPVLDIEEGMTKRAGHDTGPASDTQILVDNHPVIIFELPVAGLGRADLYAIGFFTVIADHGKVNPHMLPLDYFDPGSARIA